MVYHLSTSQRKLDMRTGAKAYAQLRDQVTKAGILKRRYRYYTILIAGTVLGLLLSAVGIYFSQSLIAVFLWSLVFMFFSVQVGGTVHDAGHRAIARSVWWNDFWGHVLSIVIAMGYSNWKWKHNMHHAHTNEVDTDPDLDIPLMSFTRERALNSKGLFRWLAKYQVFFYYLLGSLAAFSQRIDNHVFMRKFGKPEYYLEFGCYFVSMFVWFGLPFFVFSLGKAIVVLSTVHFGAGFYMLHIFAPNHKGMPELEKGTKMSFLEQQISTSRNVDGNWLTDYVYMGLNYQIEHHLFPNCPRINLPKIVPYVQAIAAKYSLDYSSVSIVKTDLIILKELHAVSRSLA